MSISVLFLLCTTTFFLLTKRKTHVVDLFIFRVNVKNFLFLFSYKQLFPLTSLFSFKVKTRQKKLLCNTESLTVDTEDSLYKCIVEAMMLIRTTELLSAAVLETERPPLTKQHPEFDEAVI